MTTINLNNPLINLLYTSYILPVIYLLKTAWMT